MIIDCHYHLEPALLSHDTLLSKMDEAGVDKAALMGVVNEPIPKPNELLLNIFRFSITRKKYRFLAKMLAAKFTPQGHIKLPAGTFKIFQNPDNEPVFKAAAKYPNRFLAWAFVNPAGKKDPVKELGRWKSAPGFTGIKAHPFWHRYNPIELAPMAAKLAKTGKPLLIHAGFDGNGDFGPLLDQVPGLKLILAHAGFPLFSETWKNIRANANVYIDLSQSSYLNDKTTKEAVEYLGVEKCLFGTDGPYGVHGNDSLFDYDFLKKRIERLFPDKGSQRKLLGDNFLKLTNA